MQKRANRILSMLLALIMVMTMLPATVFANSETDVFAGWSLTLGEDIGVNFYLAEEAANYTVDVTVAGNKAAYTTATKDGYYVVSVNVAAAQMTDVITLNVKNGDTQVHTGEYTVRQYAEKILTGAYDAEVKELVKQMLNLGAAAQTYFAYNTDLLANKGYEIDTPAAVPTEVPAIALEDNLDGVSLYGMSLLFQSKTAVRFYFVVDGDLANYTFKVGGEACEVKNSEDLYYVEIGDINPQDLGNEITVTVNDALSVSYNPLTYIVRKYNSDSSSATLKNLVQAMYGYHLEALEYQEYQRIIQVGALQQHSNNTPWVKDANETFIYFNTDAYTATTGEYTSLTADAIKLVRGGKVYSVANPGQGLLVKDNDTQHLLKITPWGMTGGHLPIQAHDYFIIEGRFESTSGDGTTIQIAKSYVYFDGTNVEISTTEPILPTTIDAGTMSAHSTTGWKSSAEAAGNLLFAMADNDAPSGYYRPTDASNVQLIRGGNTYVVGHNLRDTISKENNAQYVFEFWTIADHKPMVANDILVVEGDFYQESTKTMLNISKTYVLLNADGSASFFTKMPTLQTIVNAGAMSAHADGSASEIYFTLAANSVPVDEETNYPYTGTVKLVSGSNVSNVNASIVKMAEDQYYLELDGVELADGDYLVVEGAFSNADNGYTMNITKTYVLADGDKLVYSDTEPVLSPAIDAGVMQSHANGMSGTGIYFKLNANDAPYNGWNYEYKQTATSGIKLIRDGATIDIGIVDRPLFVKYSDTEYYLKLEKWTIGEYGVNGGTMAITTDDVIIVEGNFVYENVTLNVTKSYVYYNGSAWVCSAEAPVQKNIVDVVELGSHSNGWKTGGFYFTAAANDAPYDDWSLRYKPVSADVIKLIKADGTTTNVGNTGGETIVKYSDTEYYVEGWAIGSANLVAGNTFVIEGQFYNAANDVYIDVEKTYIILNADGTTTVLTDADKYINAGAMSAYSEKNWFNTEYTALCFVLASNNAPADEGWSVRYKPASANNVKLVRGGTTYTIGNTGAETIVKITDGTYALALDSWWWSAYAPIQDGDQLIIEGEFANASNGYILNIAKTCITFISNADDNVVFSAAADTEFGDVLLPNSAKKLKIGMWNGSYHVFEDQQLKELQAAGITKIMGIDTQWIGTTDVNAWLDRVYSYGISVIMDLRNWDGKTVPSYASHPGVLGFLMYDEPSAKNFSALANLKEKFDAVMPADKLFYVNLFPECAADSSLFGSIINIHTDYDQYYVTKFLETVGVEVLSWDNYSLLSGSGIRTDYYHNFEVMASKTAEKWYTMLSAGHGTTTTSYATPTAEELRWQMAVAMTYGVQNIDHYTYVSHEKDYSCMVEYNTWKPTALYYDILQVDNEYLAWDNIFMAYNWKGVAGVKAGSSSTMLGMLKNNIDLKANGLASVSTTQDVLVGVFDYNGDKAYMVTNAGSAGSSKVGDGKSFTMTDATVTLNLADGNYKCAAIIDQGEITYVAVNNNQIVLDVEAYEGVFVIPVLN